MDIDGDDGRDRSSREARQRISSLGSIDEYLKRKRKEIIDEYLKRKRKEIEIEQEENAFAISKSQRPIDHPQEEDHDKTVNSPKTKQWTN
ncbi:hypothetical protein QE152_g39037 [Popillia japonica]|uniref:Uncharacterized protein n=1 Tax=Popillia japonica TaxID=7064 RepID=A0AAW1HVP1_POPJA